MHRLIMICIFHYCVYLESKSQSFEVIITINFNPKCIHRIEMSRPKSKGGMLLLLLIHSKCVFARWKSVGLGPVTILHPPLVNRAVNGTSRNFILPGEVTTCLLLKAPMLNGRLNTVSKCCIWVLVF